MSVKNAMKQQNQSNCVEELLMTKAELEKDYYSDRPREPYCDDDSPNDWEIE